MGTRQARALSKAPVFIGGARVEQGSVMNYRDVTLTNAEVLAIRATPITLVPAPGSDKVYQEFVMAILIGSLTGAYTVGTNDLVIRQTDASGEILSQTIDTANWLDQTGVKVTNALPKIDIAGVLLNKALVLHNSGAGELTGGNAANTVKVRCFYRRHAFADLAVAWA